MLSTSDYAVIIPARYQSSRLPGKPLVQLNGVPMIVRTYRQCLKACPAERIHVATDDDRIREVCEQHGISVLMTSSQCLTGTDRLAECAQQLDADIFINVQGDEPVFNPDDLRRMIEACRQWPGEVLNGYCAIDEEAQFRSTSTPKVVLRPDGRLLYMSRATIPGTKSNEFVRGWRQVCLYAFPRESLAAFAACDGKTPLESLEDIEILRFLELGWEVRMLELSQDSIAVDNPEDVAAAEAAILARGL
ncbi:3-deoxy-manno-octulosonate cytidylyltransferase [Pseudomonas nitroreducens]|uniref:3-deoxy-manno-octulosonate cytidylyltransferase n=1 Tax=Pseudomonas nitroreducens TaxID=46680 RepID=UPI0028AC8143|nr:3-deoxy-manno-octulosonate cytidylyltransferase [Pseudomonas nitroreducens]